MTTEQQPQATTPRTERIRVTHVRGAVAHPTWAGTTAERLEHAWATLKENPRLSKKSLQYMTGISSSSALRIQRAMILLKARPDYRGLSINNDWHVIWKEAKDVLNFSLADIGVSNAGWL